MLFNKTWVHTIKFFWTIVGILQIMFNVKSIMQHLFPFSSIRVTKIVPCFNSHEVWIKKTVFGLLCTINLFLGKSYVVFTVFDALRIKTVPYIDGNTFKSCEKKLLNWYLPLHISTAYRTVIHPVQYLSL